jgi:hypothetical protein
MEDVRAHLAGQSKDALVELLMSQAATDARLRARLLLETAGGSSGDVDLATFRAAIDRAVEPDDYEDYRPALAYANDIEQVIDRIQALLDDGHAEAVVELARARHRGGRAGAGLDRRLRRLPGRRPGTAR